MTILRFLLVLVLLVSTLTSTIFALSDVPITSGPYDEPFYCCYTTSGVLQSLPKEFVSSTCVPSLIFEYNPSNVQDCSHVGVEQNCNIGGAVVDKIASGTGIYELYDNTNILDYLETSLGDDACLPRSNVVSTSASISNSGELTQGTGDSQEGTLTNGGVTVTESDASEYDNEQNRAVVRSEAIESCREGLDFYGFFEFPSTCEARVASDDSQCIYNPENLGLLGAEITATDLTSTFFFDFDKNSCFPSGQITSCGELHTKTACEGINQLGLDFSCTWEDNLSSFQMEGICLSNRSKTLGNSSFFNSSKFYNVDELDRFRGNFLLNPSFEDNLTHWDNSSPLSILDNSTIAFSGSQLLNLSSGQQLSQDIYFLENNSQYYFVFAAMAPFGGNISFDIKDSSGSSVVDSQIKTFSLTNTTYFKFYSPFYSGFRITGGDLENLTLSLEVQSGEIYLDAVSLQKSLGENVEEKSQIYIPTHMIPKEASYCDLCFSEGSFNSCDKNKSLSLGDCSYMTDFPSLADGGLNQPYFVSPIGNRFFGGYEKNLYMSEYNDFSTGNFEKFSGALLNYNSKSMPNSQLYCELYLTNTTCTNSSNFINSYFTSLHPYASETLCKWDETYGCFKDSNGDNFPDFSYVDGFPVSYNIDGDDYPFMNFINSTFFDFSRTSSSNGIFEVLNLEVDGEYSNYMDYACDFIPPTFYAHIKAQNISGDEVVLLPGENYSDSILGNVELYVYGNDYIPTHFSCKNLMTSADQVGYLNGEFIYDNGSSLRNFTYKKGVSFQQESGFDLEDFFGFDLPSANSSQLTLRYLDQSGNLAQDRIFEIEKGFDFAGPFINLSGGIGVNPRFHIIDLNNPIENLTVRDDVDFSCDYFLTTDDLDANYNESIFNVTSNNFDSNSNYEINFSQLIFEPENNKISPTTYKLNVTCNDLFNQTTSEEFIISIDFFTDITLVSPNEFISYEEDVGFFNSSTFEMTFYSKEEGKLWFPYASPEFNLVSGTQFSYVDFSSPLVHTNGETYMYNYSDEVEFTSTSLGIKTADIRFEELSSGAFVEDNFTYVYDTQAPELKTFNLTAQPQSQVYFNGTHYFTISDSIGFNFGLYDNHSWISDSKYNLTIDTGTDYAVLSTAPTFSPNIDNKSRNVTFSSINPSGFLGTPTGEVGLNSKDFKFKFYDKAGNSETSDISFYYDNSTPQISITGDNVTLDVQTGNLFTNVLNPNITISITNTSQYRKNMSCTLEFENTYNNYASLSFQGQLSNFDLIGYLSGYPGLDAPGVSMPKLLTTCVDVYGEVFSLTVDVVFDQTAPEIESVTLMNGSPVYMATSPNLVIEDLQDQVEIGLVSASDEVVSCLVDLEAGDYIDSCDSSLSSLSFTQSGFPLSLTSEDLSLLNGRPSGSEDFVCSRSSSLSSILANPSSHSEAFVEANIKYSAQCEDLLAQKSQLVEGNFTITYILDSSLSNPTLWPEQGQIFARVESYSDVYDSVLLYNGSCLDKDVVLSTASSQEILGSGMYEFNFSGISLNDVEEGLADFCFVPSVGGTPFSVDEVQNSLYIDKTPPSPVELDVAGIFDGFIYMKNFSFSTYALDAALDQSYAKMDYLELYDGSELLFSSKNISDVSSDLISDTLECTAGSNTGVLSGTCVGSEELGAEGRYNDAQIGQVFNLRLDAYDYFGNKNSTNLTFELKDGIYLIPQTKLPDVLAKSSGSQGFLTSSTSPKLYFTPTSPISEVQYCNYDLNLDDGTSSSGQLTIEGGNLTLDLATLGVSLEDELDTLAVLDIACKRSDDVMSYLSYDVVYVDYISDFVLEAPFGFKFIENDEEDNTPQFTITPVGPMYDLTCSYKINSLDWQELASSNFELNQSSELVIGENSLLVECEDLFGVKTPQKEYTIYYNPDEELEVLSMSLVDENGDIYTNISSNIFISSQGDYTLLVELNKQVVDSCSYDSSPTGALYYVDRFLDFFTGADGTFASFGGVLESQITLDDDQEIRLTCYDEDITQFEFEFDVELLDPSFSYSSAQLNS